MAIVYRATWPGAPGSEGTQVLWRSLSWKEFREISDRHGHRDLMATGPMDLYMEVYDKVLVAGPSPEDVSAGIATNVALQQLRDHPFSGQYDAVAGKVVEKRQWIQSNYLECCRSVIAATFHIPFSEMDGWDADTLFEYMARAEFAVGNRWDPANPNAQPEPAPASPNQPVDYSNLDPRRVAYLKAKERRRQADIDEAGQSSPQSPDVEQFTWR